jgi:uncharacterized membrane protein YphA (DoxX/SURF4 family)
MRKRKMYHYFFIMAGTMLLCGCIRLLVDWLQYSSTLNSAPFSVWILVIGTTYGGAALLCVVIGLLLRRTERMRKDRNP